jgi:hypothetical protein
MVVFTLGERCKVKENQEKGRGEIACGRCEM